VVSYSFTFDGRRVVIAECLRVRQMISRLVFQVVYVCLALIPVPTCLAIVSVSREREGAGIHCLQISCAISYAKTKGEGHTVLTYPHG